jgi:hypothetical protein
MKESWLDKINGWMKEGKEDSKTILGIPWDTEVTKTEDADIILASHPKFPYRVGILIGKEFVSLHMDPGILTDALDVNERMRIYKKLLRINAEFNQMKTGLKGAEDQIILSVDLNITGLTKTEFSDAITFLVMGAARMIQDLGLIEDLTTAMIERNATLIAEKLKLGQTRDEVLSFLIHRVGLNREYAEQLVDDVLVALAAGEEGEDGSETGVAFVKPAPDNLYS